MKLILHQSKQSIESRNLVKNRISYLIQFITLNSLSGYSYIIGISYFLSHIPLSM